MITEEYFAAACAALRGQLATTEKRNAELADKIASLNQQLDAEHSARMVALKLSINADDRLKQYKAEIEDLKKQLASERAQWPRPKHSLR